MASSEGSQAPQQTVNIQNSQQQPEKYKVPAGLRPLLEAFARETLRTQPQDLVQFGRVFFETLGEQRESEFKLRIYYIMKLKITIFANHSRKRRDQC